MSEKTLNITLNSMRNVAARVHRCPACHSPHIYTTTHVTYVFDHIKGCMKAITCANLVENSWHGCFACDHQWVSLPLLQTAVPVEPPRPRPDNVIDLQTFRQSKQHSL